MPVIGGKQSQPKKTTTVIKKKLEPKVEPEVVETPKDETVSSDSHSFTSIQPIRKRVNNNRDFLKQVVSATVEETPVNTTHSDVIPISTDSPVNQLVDAIVSKLDEKFVAREELEQIVLTMVDEKLKSLLVDPNKKNKTSTKNKSNQTIVKDNSKKPENSKVVNNKHTSTPNKPKTQVVKRK